MMRWMSRVACAWMCVLCACESTQQVTSGQPQGNERADAALADMRVVDAAIDMREPDAQPPVCALGVERSCGPAEGRCSAGVQICLGDAWSRCVDVIEPTIETCDGTDEDCDGRVDEATERACGSAVGACVAGTETCSNSMWAACAGQTEPAEELCNDIDDDCDGLTDEGLTERCGTAEGLCIPGERQCMAGEWGACAPVVGPDDEICDGLNDEDCDGSVDEGCDCREGESRDCGIATGACVVGRQACVGGAWGDCVGAVGPDVETCNDQDDDCDGQIDESLSRGCGIAVGVCVPGTEQCARGSWSGCNATLPGEETCDGRDEDCDGRIDESIVREDTCGVGRCQRSGIARCADGVFVSECLPGEGVEELCNLIDDDCDGMPDEAIDGSQTECGVGACSSTGAMVCQAGVMIDTCATGAPMADDQCDGVDDDCDGSIDEAWVRPECGLGACAVGAAPAECVDGLERPCRPVVEPADEICNGSDDDCDGFVDEGIPDLGAPCFRIADFCEQQGTWVCAPDGTIVCNAAEPQIGPEVCNDQDDDCDGAVDEILNAEISPVIPLPFEGAGIVQAVARGANILVSARETETEALWLGIFDVNGQTIEPWWPFEPDQRIVYWSINSTSTGWAVGFKPRSEPLAESPMLLRRLDPAGEQARADIFIGPSAFSLRVFETVLGYRVFFDGVSPIRAPQMLDFADDGTRLAEPLVLSDDPLPARLGAASVDLDGRTLVVWMHQGFRDPWGFISWRMFDGVQPLGGGQLCQGCRSPGVGYGVLEDNGGAEIGYRSGNPTVSVARLSDDGAVIEDVLLNQVQTLLRFDGWRYRVQLTANGSRLQYVDSDLMAFGPWVDLPPNLSGFFNVDGEAVRVRTHPGTDGPMGFSFYRGPLACNPPE